MVYQTGPSIFTKRTLLGVTENQTILVSHFSTSFFGVTLWCHQTWFAGRLPHEMEISREHHRVIELKGDISSHGNDCSGVHVMIFQKIIP
jgi:hypothetical protein